VDRAILNRTPPHRPSEQHTDIGRDADSYLDGGVWPIDPINRPREAIVQATLQHLELPSQDGNLNLDRGPSCLSEPRRSSCGTPG